MHDNNVNKIDDILPIDNNKNVKNVSTKFTENSYPKTINVLHQLFIHFIIKITKNMTNNIKNPNNMDCSAFIPS